MYLLLAAFCIALSRQTPHASISEANPPYTLCIQAEFTPMEVAASLCRAVKGNPSLITVQTVIRIKDAGTIPPGEIGWFDSVPGTRRAARPSKPCKFANTDFWETRSQCSILNYEGGALKSAFYKQEEEYMNPIDGNGSWQPVSAVKKLSRGMRVRGTGETGKTWGFGNEDNPSHRERSILDFNSDVIKTEGGKWELDGRKDIEVYVPFNYSPNSECRASAQKEPLSMKKYNLAKVITTGTEKLAAHTAAIADAKAGKVAAITAAVTDNAEKIASGKPVEIVLDTAIVSICDRTETLRKSIETLAHCDGTDVEDCSEVQNLLADLPIPQTNKKLVISLA